MSAIPFPYAHNLQVQNIIKLTTQILNATLISILWTSLFRFCLPLVACMFIRFWSQVKWNIICSFVRFGKNVRWLNHSNMVLNSHCFLFFSQFFFLFRFFVVVVVILICFVHRLGRCWWNDLGFFHTFHIYMFSCNWIVQILLFISCISSSSHVYVMNGKQKVKCSTPVE